MTTETPLATATPQQPPKPPLTTTTSIWPAALVLIIAVVMLGVFITLNAVTDQGVTTTTTLPVFVGGLPTQTGASSGALLLEGCHQDGTPPNNIISAFLVPAVTRADGPFAIPNSGAGDFDCHRNFITSASPGALLSYYKTQLEARGWNLFSSGASNGAPQYLFQKAGSDTFYWELGVTVLHRESHRTTWKFEIYQNSQTI